MLTFVLSTGNLFRKKFNCISISSTKEKKRDLRLITVKPSRHVTYREHNLINYYVMQTTTWRYQHCTYMETDNLYTYIYIKVSTSCNTIFNYSNIFLALDMFKWMCVYYNIDTNVHLNIWIRARV